MRLLLDTYIYLWAVTDSRNHLLPFSNHAEASRRRRRAIRPNA